MAKTSVVLSFHEVLLHQSDIELLNGPHWLNDTIISFYFEYLEKVTFRNASELLFISPEVTQCIKMVEANEIKIFLEPLNIHSKKFVFFALNDNNSPDTAGGSHWSLLVYSKMEGCFFHFDSSSGSNHNVAWDFSSHLMSYLSKANKIQKWRQDLGTRSVDRLLNRQKDHLHAVAGACWMQVARDPSSWRLLREAYVQRIKADGSINFINKECAQQSNGYDCGVHVICNTERLAEYARNHKEIGSCDMSIKINHVAKRKEILNLIQNLSSR